LFFATEVTEVTERKGFWLPNREILPLSGRIFFITAESAESAEKKLYNKKKHLCVLRVLCGE
jgi:hypothetical protein